MTKGHTQNARRADSLSRILNSVGYFRGKGRLADMLGRLAHSGNDTGVFPLPDGMTASADLSDRIQRLMWGAAYEPIVTRCLTALLGPGDTFVDVGAHIGFFSLIASSCVGPTGKVYSFEADRELFRRLQTNATPYPWLMPYWRVVWKHSGPIDFSNPKEPGESGWGKVAAVRNKGHVVSVDAISLDEWHESVGSIPVRALKIDAEGSEPFILEGMKGLIAKTYPILIVELNEQLLREAGYTTDMIVETIRDDRYRIFAMTSRGLEECKESAGVDSSEILCLPTNKVEETRLTFRRASIPWRKGRGFCDEQYPPSAPNPNSTRSEQSGPRECVPLDRFLRRGIGERGRVAGGPKRIIKGSLHPCRS